jgi:hypothetical protein
MLNDMNLADWATLLAAVGTLGALWVGAMTLRLQVNHTRRAQASHVSTWVERGGEAAPSAEILKVHNGSPQPIYDVMVTCSQQPGARGSALGRRFSRVLPAGATLCEPIPTEAGGQGLETFSAVTFRDSAGLSWFKDNHGELKRKSRY